MDNFAPGAATHFNVAIIGGGPAGLSAAIELKKRGVSRVAVLDREPHAGGIPRHCGHLAFGMREFKRILTGPDYARRLVQAAQDAGAEIYTVVTVAEARPGGELLIITERGTGKISADRIIYATGVRETPRSARLISGNRPQGIMNTGALQSMVYLKNRKPFNCPVIIGTELVSFSAIMTCRHARIRPVAMIEEAPQVTARWPASLTLVLSVFHCCWILTSQRLKGMPRSALLWFKRQMVGSAESIVMVFSLQASSRQRRVSRLVDTWPWTRELVDPRSTNTAGVRIPLILPPAIY